MSRGRAILAVLAVFLAGFVAGALALHLVRLRIEATIFHSSDPVARLIVYKLNQELRLSAQQRRAVYQVIVGTRSDLLALHADLAPRILAIFDSAQGRIRTFLDAKQQARFDEIVAERRRLLAQTTTPPAPTRPPRE